MKPGPISRLAKKASRALLGPGGAGEGRAQEGLALGGGAGLEDAASIAKRDGAQRDDSPGAETVLGPEGASGAFGTDSADALAEKREMIRGIQELGETTVKEVMVPRTDALFLPLDIGREELLSKVAGSGHSRIPVYRGSVDEVVGILYAKDLLRALVGGGSLALEDLVRKPFFVPETKRIDSLLREMKRRRVHIAVAVDEYGGVSGIVFLEDIIEEIVGEIDDEFDEAREEIISLGEGLWLCDAMTSLDDLRDRLGLYFPDEDSGTLAGLLFDLFGRIPNRQESVRDSGFEFTVQDMNGNRITSVKLRKLPSEGEGGEK
jgi:CBS domain containing-hemolysin-like protein